MDESIAILIVDDDAVDRMAVRRALRTSGLLVQAEEAEDRNSAMAALARSSFDCMMLDYRLPGADGLAVLREMRASGVSIPIIVLTGQGDERTAVELMKAGATDYLSKNQLTPELLASSIRKALRVYRAEIQAAAAEDQRHHAEAALRKNEQLLAITLKSIGDAVIATNADGCVTFMNAVAEMLTGWSESEAAGQSLDHVLPMLRRPSLEPLPGLAEQVLGSGTIVTMGPSAALRAQAGGLRAITGSAAPIRDDLGATIGVVVSFRDITQQVRTEERLRFLAETSRRLAVSLDHRANLAGLVQLAIPYFADWCAVDLLEPQGVERVAVASREAGAFADCFSPEAGTFGPHAVTRSGAAERYPVREADMATDTGRALGSAGIGSYLCVPLSARGRTIGALTLARAANGHRYTADDAGFAEEIARRVALAVDNALLYEDAQSAIRTRDVFLSIAAHELKTPLTSLLGYTYLLQRRLQLGATVEERTLRALQVAVNQAERLNKLITSLLDISRLQTGQLTIEHKPVNLSDLIERIVVEIQPTLETHTLHLETQEPALNVIGDELRLEQVFHNLIQNAVKYSPSGGPVQLRLARQGEWVSLSVRDQGLGIPPEALSEVFSRFYRASNINAHNISGMGVGLYVVKQIVALHNGDIVVESKEGEGSEFTVLLPALPAGSE